MARKTWVQHPETGELIPKEEYVRDGGSAYIQGDIEPFVSPITGETITSRSRLRAHNAQHNVTDSRDYSHEFLMARSQKRINEMTGNTPQAKRERIDLIKRELARHGR